MAHVLFSDADGWELANKGQDIRGWEVRDSTGALIGRVGDMAVDTDRQVVDTVILDDGARFPASDVTLADGVVYVTRYGAPSGVTTRAYTDVHGVRRVDPDDGVRERVAERAEARHEAAEGRRDAGGYADFEDDFRSHYRDTYSDLDFADYSPAYRYGYDVAYDDRYAGRGFDDVEPDLRAAYYRRFGYPMSDNIVWSRVKGAVRHAFDRVRDAV